MLGRVNAVGATSQDSDCDTASVQRCPVGGAVDPAGKPADDGNAGSSQTGCERSGHGDRARRRRPGPYNGHGRSRQGPHVPANPEDGGRIVDGGQQWWIPLVADRHRLKPVSACSGERAVRLASGLFMGGVREADRGQDPSRQLARGIPARIDDGFAEASRGA
jgi:hypothetical protein